MRAEPKPGSAGYRDPAATATAVSGIIEQITQQLAAGKKSTGFGKFSVAQRGPRRGINPRTCAPLQIPARIAAKFSPGADLKKAVN
ncbi:MAG: hypothetical protein E6G48_03805 [Actinobacteria bacterium]|nr:MAG: hypothetical protein E6G48_03805 [Actinomycetota bacterium]